MTTATAQERLAASLACYALREKQVRAFVTLDADGAGAQARASDARHAVPRRLEGVVVGVKDVIDVAGLPTRFGSRAGDAAGPATTDAVVVERLRMAGATILGKVKTTEFAFTDPTDTDNPAAPGHTPGGSSSGSAAAVAAGMADLCLGTQTVGSVCRPAAYCGVAGFKPSTGGLPLAGVAPLAPDFDTVGILARDMALAVTGWQVCAGLGDFQLPDVRAEGLRIGVLSDPLFRAISPQVDAAMTMAADVLRSFGAQIVPITTGVDHGLLRADHRILMAYDSAQNYGALLARGSLLGVNWRGLLETGQGISIGERIEAFDRLRDARNRLQACMGEVEALLLPPAADVAPFGHTSTGDAGLIVSWTVMGGPLAVLPVKREALAPPTAVMLTCLPGRDLWLSGFARGFEIQLGQTHDGY